MSKDGGPAFPRAANQWASDNGTEGMSLRDYFAAKVLQVACEDQTAAVAAKVAYEYADAMLKAREQ